MLVLLPACARREEAPAAPASVAVPASTPVVAVPVVLDAGAPPPVTRVPALPAAEPEVEDAGIAPAPITQGHFIYIGPKADLARTRARVDRAFVEQGKTNHNGSLPSLRKLDVELKENYVKVTVEGARLRGEMNPALPHPAWEASFSIDEHDRIDDLTVATIAPEPTRPRRP